jgi:hypothetical protein
MNKKRDHFEKLTLKGIGYVEWSGFISLRIMTIYTSCEHDNEIHSHKRRSISLSAE